MLRLAATRVLMINKGCIITSSAGLGFQRVQYQQLGFRVLTTTYTDALAHKRIGCLCGTGGSKNGFRYRFN
ncbi:hypothetical protein SAMN05216436_11482 [bacterium A37T11]|nr:hypothetical protein SAMN05216436_11482 [bacterium A37T11]